MNCTSWACVPRVFLTVSATAASQRPAASPASGGAAATVPACATHSITAAMPIARGCVLMRCLADGDLCRDVRAVCCTPQGAADTAPWLFEQDGDDSSRALSAPGFDLQSLPGEGALEDAGLGVDEVQGLSV